MDESRTVGVIGGWLAAQGRRLASGWHTDMTDVSQLARLRARILLAAALLGVLATVASVTLSRGTYLALPWFVPGGVILGLIIFAGHAAVRGRRMTDVEFAGVIASSQVYAAVSVTAGQGAGHVASTALCLVASNVMAALFIERRLLVAAQPLIGVTSLVVVARSPAAGPSAFVDVSSGAFVLIIIVAIVRPLRDLAIGALRTARRGEVTDPLTGLNNRWGLERAGVQYWKDRAPVSPSSSSA